MTKSMVLGYGIAEIVYIISKKLLEIGYEVTILTTWLEYPLGEQKIEVKELSPLRMFFLSDYWHRHLLTDIRCVNTFTRALKEYDVVITCDPMHIIGASVKIKFKKPVIMYYFGVVPHSVLDSFGRRLESFRQKLLWNLSFNLADYTMTNSKYTKSLLPRKVEDRAVVNYHGIEHLVFSEDGNAEEFRRKMKIEDKKLILSVGRFSSPYKGMKDLVRIFTKLKRKWEDAALLLVGGGGIPKDVANFRSLKNVHLLTNVSYETLKLCFASCDIYCTASKWEGFDIPLVAAQSNGKPVVAFNVGAHPEVMIDRETGFLVKNYEEFEKYLELLLNDDLLRKEMGKKAAKYAKRFTWGKSIKILKTLVETACESYKP